MNYAIESDEYGKYLLWHTETEKKPIKLRVEIDAFIARQNSFPAAKQGAFNQSLGRKTSSVLDATGGWGGDALLMCSQGYRVTVIERNPVLCELLEDGFNRLAVSQWAIKHKVTIPKLVKGDASLKIIHVMAEGSVDCVYLDPMFPPKKKSNAASNKYMAFLHQLLAKDSDDQSTLLHTALNSAAPRISVKRPHYAQPLAMTGRLVDRQPDQQFSSKLVHFDVYLNN